TGDLEKVRYLHCPVCKDMMNRVNFANCSHVIVDVCRQHGTWFDKDELRRIIEFIRAGGLDKARAMQIEGLEDQRRQLKAAEMSIPTDTGGSTRYSDDSGSLGSWAIGAAIDSLFGLR